MPALEVTSGDRFKCSMLLEILYFTMLKYTGFIYCPRCASTSLEPFHENGIRCKVCRFIYFHNSASAVGAIITTSRGILLVRRAHQPQKGLLDVPGGFVDYNENLESALKREVLEELNIEITDWKYLGSFPNTYKYESVTYHTVDTIFTCHYNEKNTPVANDEISEVVWVDDIRSFSLDQMAFNSTKAAMSMFKSKFYS